MRITLQEIAARLDGVVVGDGTSEVSDAVIIRDAQANQITLAEDPKYADSLAECPASAILTHPDFPTTKQARVEIARERLHTGFGAVVSWFHPPRSGVEGVSPQALISDSARLGVGVQVGPRAWIADDVVIGDHCRIHAGVQILPGCVIGERTEVFPNAVLHEKTTIGARCLIHAGAVLGAYGFGYASSSQGHQLSAQVGWVELADDVEIGANSTIDRGTFGATYVGEGTKVDNMVQIAHNCRIGRHNILCSQVGIAGSTTTGDFVVLGGQVGVRDHVHLGDGSSVGAKSGVSCDIGEGESFFGIPANPGRQQMVMLKSMKRLPELRQQVRRLLQRVDELERPAAAGEAQDAA